MSDAGRLRPPSGGMAPPTTATLPDGTPLDLIPLAREIADEHLARHPEEVERYGDAVRAWCVHDNQHLLNWAALDLAGAVDFEARCAGSRTSSPPAAIRWRASPTTCAPRRR